MNIRIPVPKSSRSELFDDECRSHSSCSTYRTGTRYQSLAELEIVPRPEVRESTNIDDLSDASSDDEEFEEYVSVA